MAGVAVELTGFALGILGMIGNMAATLLPSWQVSAHIGSNIVTAESNMKGLWMECVRQSTGVFQCDTFNTVLGLTTDLQVARIMMVISIMFSVLACALSSIGMQCTVLFSRSLLKGKLAGAGGYIFMTAGLLSLVPVSWKMNEIVQSFHNANLPDSQKFEIGDCLYIGIASSLVSMVAGGLLSMSCWSTLDGQQPSFRQGYLYHKRLVKHGTATCGAWYPVTFNPSANPQSTINMNPTNNTQANVSQGGGDSPLFTGSNYSRKAAGRKTTTNFRLSQNV